MRRDDGMRLLRQVSYEQRAFWRNPALAVLSFALPLTLVLVFGSFNAGVRIGGAPAMTYYLPSLTAYGLIGLYLNNVGQLLLGRRRSGSLMRVRSTPCPAWIILGGMVGSYAILGSLLVLILTVTGAVLFDVEPALSAYGLLILAVGSVTFMALGMAVSTIVGNGDAAAALLGLISPALSLVSGVFFPLKGGSLLATAAACLPLRHFILGLQAGGPNAEHLSVLLVWAVVGLLVALTCFRWRPDNTDDRRLWK